jgi:hypothetical protein
MMDLIGSYRHETAMLIPKSNNTNTSRIVRSPVPKKTVLLVDGDSDRRELVQTIAVQI